MSSKKAAIFVSFLITAGLSACGKGSSGIPGVKDFHAGISDGRLNISLLTTALHWDVGGSVPIPQLDDATLSVQPDLMSTGVIFSLSAPIESILKNSPSFAMSALPDGRAIPGIESGQMHRTDVELGNGFNISLYINSEAFGFFAPLPIKQKGLAKYLKKPVMYWITDSKGNRIGKAYLMPPTSKDGSGMGLMVLLAGMVNQQLL